MAEGKWIHGLTPDLAVSKAAHMVLAARFKVVLDYLPLAIRHARDDSEHVHQLRVATRRADAALWIFRRCLPGKRYRTVRARLRIIRRAAGAARDWDVFLADLASRLKTASDKEVAGLDFLLAYALGQRDAAQPALTSLEQDPNDTFEQVIKDTLSALEAPSVPEPCLGELAREVLAAQYKNLSEAASGDLKDYERLHQVRIEGKRLRYAIEVLADCFGEEVRKEIYPRIEHMQEVLGTANDSHVATGRLRALRKQIERYPSWSRVQTGLVNLLNYHLRRLPRERRRFVSWWKQWQGEHSLTF